MNVHLLHPLSDDRWDDLVARHPRASVFHQRGWLEALSRTYRYQPLVLTYSPSGPTLASAMVVCRVASWLTGTRLVSVPFADHCEPLVENPYEIQIFTDWLRDECDRNRLRYVEIRPTSPLSTAAPALTQARSYWFHELDLSDSLENIYGRLHKNSFRRKIRRAEREHLSYEVGRSHALVDEFYQLLLMTRRRQRLLPQPRSWFANLVECMGDNAHVRIARKSGTPVAAMLTLRHRSHVVFKYGCSNAALHNVGGIPFLFWRLIEECKSLNLEKIDLGRSDLDHEGLVAFKDRLGAQKRQLVYHRYTSSGARQEAALWKWRGVREILQNMPDTFFSIAGRVLYRHMG